MQYFFTRLSLVRRSRPPMFDLMEPREEISRQEFLRNTFNKQIDFFYRKSRIVYLFLGEARDEKMEYLVAKVGRPHDEVVNGPPESGFEEKQLETWRASNLFFNISDDPAHGQTISMQYRSDVGYPHALLEALIETVNASNIDAPWHIELAPVTQEQSFWEAVETFGNDITAVQFSFYAPNILGLRSSLSDGLKDARDKNRATQVDISLKNDEGGLDLYEDNIREGIEYVTKGGGTAKLKNKNKTLFDTSKSKKTIKPENDQPVSPDNNSVWVQLIKSLFK